jgi:ankyrin repeat protein
MRNNKLFNAASEGNLQEIKELLDRGADVYAKNDEGHTVISYAFDIKVI